MIFPLVAFSMAVIIGAILTYNLKEKIKNSKTYILSFVSGSIIGVTSLKIMPEAFESFDASTIAYGILTGISVPFIVETFYITHLCYDIECDYHKMGIFAYIAIFLHGFFDGFFINSFRVLNESVFIGILPALLIHKLFDGVLVGSIINKKGDFILMLLIAASTPSGMLVSSAIDMDIFKSYGAFLTGLASGHFLYFSSSDIIPALHRERKTSSVFGFLIGIAYSIILK